MRQCSDLTGDRQIGKFWEREFGKMAYSRGRIVIPLQWDKATASVGYLKEFPKPLTLPDMGVGDGLMEWHEIKHKDPTSKGLFGLEEYRFKALLVFQAQTIGTPVFYTIHNYNLQPGESRHKKKHCTVNHEEHWRVARISDLDGKHTRKQTGQSWVNGKPEDVQILYWPESAFKPLSEIWNA